MPKEMFDAPPGGFDTLEMETGRQSERKAHDAGVIRVSLVV